MKKHVLILEDNTMLSEALEKAIGEYDGGIAVHRAETYEEACAAALTYKIELFILDIILSTKHRSDTSGIQFADRIRKCEEYCFTPIIFTTVLSAPQMHAFKELHCYGYLEKPFSIETAMGLIKDALRYKAYRGYADKKTIYLRKDGILFPIQLSDIIFVQSHSHSLLFHLKDETIDIPYMTIKQFLKESADFGFMQCSKNMVVNKQYIRNVDIPNRYLQLGGEIKKVDIGRTFCKKIRQELLHV